MATVISYIMYPIIVVLYGFVIARPIIELLRRLNNRYWHTDHFRPPVPKSSWNHSNKNLTPNMRIIAGLLGKIKFSQCIVKEKSAEISYCADGANFGLLSIEDNEYVNIQTYSLELDITVPGFEIKTKFENSAVWAAKVPLASNTCREEIFEHLHQLDKLKT